ncbi:MAG: PAS-domain containing protein [Rhizobiaceae bacterium]
MATSPMIRRPDNRYEDGAHRHALRNHALLESGLNLLEQGITIFDRELRLVHANRTFITLYGLPQSFIQPGTTFEDINRFLAENGDFGPGDVDELVRERVERARAFEDHYFERTRPNGKVIAVEGHALATGGWVAVYTDISVRKHHESLLKETADRLSTSLLKRTGELEATNRELNAANRALEEVKRQLQESDLRMRTIMRSVPAHIAYLDREGVYRFSNNRFSGILRHQAEELAGMKVDEVFDPSVLEVLKPAIANAVAGEASSVEIDPVDETGVLRHVRTSLVPDIVSDGTVRGIYVLSLDITEERRAMEMLVHTKRIEAAIQLTSGVVHDFSNIMTIIAGNLNRLAEHDLPEAEREHILSVTRRAVERGGRVTDQLMSFSRNEELNPVECDVARISSDLVRLFAASLDPSITIATQGANNLGALVDERALQDALLNLLLNARDAIGHDGAITVTVDSQDRDGMPVTRISVSDTGCGFSAGTIEKACDAFFSTKQGGRGRGLGLSMVRRFVKRSGGELLIESEPGEGAVVTMYLPAAAILAELEDHEGGIEPAGEPITGLALVVDDEPDIREFMRRLLVRRGVKVMEASGPQEAFDLVSNIPMISLVISDIMMQGSQTGLDLCRRIRRERADLPILLVSGMATHHPVALEANGEFMLLRKPFGESEFASALSRIVVPVEVGNREPGDGHKDV